MPIPTATRGIDLLVTDPTSGRGGGAPPIPGGGGGEDKRGSPRKPPQRRYSTAITLVMISVLMFFLVPSVTFVVLERTSETWVHLRLPRILPLNAVILLTSSFTLERARAYLSVFDFSGFRRLWRITTILGIAFVAGQLVAWRQLVAAGVHMASTQAGSLFYIISGAHAVHLLGGIAALIYVAVRNFERGKISRTTAATIVSYYWHFMDGLWVSLLGLLYLAR